MPRRRYTSPEEIRERIAKANEMRRQKAELKAEYDSVYRRSSLFRVMVLVRIVVIVYTSYLFALDDVFFYTRVDVIASSKIERKEIRTRRSKYTEIYAHLCTKADRQYDLYIGEGNGYRNEFEAGDTIVVQHTILGKTSYVASVKSADYYPTEAYRGFRIYLLLVSAVSLLSLFMISGYDLSSRYFVRFASIVAAAVFILYLAW